MYMYPAMMMIYHYLNVHVHVQHAYIYMYMYKFIEIWHNSFHIYICTILEGISLTVTYM